MAKKKTQGSSKTSSQPGAKATAEGKTLRSYQVGALPIINRILRRMRLRDILGRCLPPDDARTILPTARRLLVLVRNILVSREPIYGVGEWTARYAPDLLDLKPRELKLLNDDRLGRCLDRLFDGLDTDLIMTVVRQVIDEFQLSLEELHNDSTTVSFYGSRGPREPCAWPVHLGPILRRLDG